VDLWTTRRGVAHKPTGPTTAADNLNLEISSLRTTPGSHSQAALLRPLPPSIRGSSQPFTRVFRISPDRGTLTLLADDFLLPNGLAFSPDESVLYINDSSRRHIRAFALAPNGTVARQTDRVFADLSGSERGVPDGMKVDIAGNVYCGGSGGIYILDPKGKKLGRIVHGYPATTNIAFGGDDWKTLFFTNRNALGSVNLKIAGLPVPTPKKS
jgi:sugar lactone lactonase YvrE